MNPSLIEAVSQRIRRYELKDSQQQIGDLFSSSEGKRGGQWQDHRTVVNRMLWVLSSGAPWRDLPKRYGKWATVYERLRRYRKECFFDVILQQLQLKLNEHGLIDFDVWQMDSTITGAHKSAAGAGLKRGPNNLLYIQ